VGNCSLVEILRFLSITMKKNRSFYIGFYLLALRSWLGIKAKEELAASIQSFEALPGE